MARFADISLLSLVHDGHEAAMASNVPFARQVTALRVAPLRNRVNGVLHLFSSKPLTHSLLDAPGSLKALNSAVAANRPDVVFAYCSGMARFAFAPTVLDIPFVLDMVDVDSAKWARMAAAGRGVRRWIYQREARTLRPFEVRAVRRAVTTLVVNDRERDAMLELAPGAPVVSMPNGIDVDAFAPPEAASQSATVVFCGVMSYAPNIEGVLWFSKHVWPLVRASHSDARLIIVGADPTREIRALVSEDSSIHVTGAVPAVQPYLWNAAVAIAPLWMTQGLQNKVLEALAAGVPVVTTPTVAAGLPPEALPGTTIAANDNAFADAVLESLRSSPAERRRRAGLAHIDRLTWSSQLQQLETIVRGAAAMRL